VTWRHCALVLLLSGAGLSSGCDRREAAGHAIFASPQVHPIALDADGRLLYVANTTSNSVSVIDTASRSVLREIDVGLEPVSLALRPDGRQLFVSNHVSDSVSVIDTDARSPMRHRVVETVQDFDGRGATRFDEPVGIAFASDAKAYVALSSRNQIAVLERGAAGRWQVRPARIRIRAQEPRAIAVRDGRLYVAAFESGNQTRLSVCARGDDPPRCTFGPLDPPSDPPRAFSVHIVSDPDSPDRDVFVFDTRDESPVDVVSHVGTLLYGLAVGAKGRVFVAHTDARNGVNGLRGGKLVDLDNRVYLNRIAAIDCGGAKCRFDPDRQLWNLEPLPPARPADGRQLATPFAIAVGDDDATVFATAAASDRLFAVDAKSGAVRGVLDVGHFPRGLALRSDPASRAAETAYVLDTLDDRVDVIDVRDPDRLRWLASIPVGHDPTPDEIRRGRIAFETARASSSGTFACGSCHPDGHMDELIWRIGGECSTQLSPLCGEPLPRVTKPIRGLRNTLPLHWDGALGDPYGGPNGAVGVNGDVAPNCTLEHGDHDCFLHLVRASLGAVMCDQRGTCEPGGARLSRVEQDDMASFLASVWLPPARSRAIDDHLSPSARVGFSQFYVDQGGLDRGTCADTTQGCHVLPLGASTNGKNPVVGAFDAPSPLGLTDRYVQQSLGGNASDKLLRFMNAPYGLSGPFAGTPPSKFPYDPEIGYDEASTFAVGFLYFRVDMGVPDAVDLFQMIEEESTGFSGATGRQVELDAATLADDARDATLALLERLEAAAARGVVRLAGEATRMQPQPGAAEPVDYRAEDGSYSIAGSAWTRSALLDAARRGTLAATLTAQLPERFGEGIHRQPLLATATTGPGPTGDPPLPVLAGAHRFALRGIDVNPDARTFVDGDRVPGYIRCLDGTAGTFCENERIELELDAPPTEPGLHLVQVQNPDGPLSNELPVCVPPIESCK